MKLSRVILPGLVLLGWPAVSGALDSDTFSPSGSAFDGRGVLQLEQPGLAFKGASYTGLGMAWTDDPILIEHADGSEDPLVHTLFGTYLAGGYNILGKVRVDLGLPLYPYSGAPEAAWSGFSFGDLRLGALVPLLAPEGRAAGFGLHTAFTLPTGNADRYTGAQGLGLDLVALAGGKLGSLGWSTNLGLALSRAEDLGDLTLGTSLEPGAGLSYSLSESLLLGTEITSVLTMAGGLGPFNKNPTEGHLYAQYAAAEGLVFSAGAGTGLVAGIGAPDLRLFALLSYHSQGEPPVYDQDADGILDEFDACPVEPEDSDGFEDADGCPDLDNDQDSIADDRDQCPRQPEDMDTYKDLDGCPDPDNDGDLVLDTEDECPKQAGTLATMGCPDQDNDRIVDSVDMCVDQAGPAATKGCPDGDNDRIPDHRDECPDEPADRRVDPNRSNGCPARVIITRQKIEILEKIHFETGKSRIRRDSYPLLEEISDVLNANPDIELVEVAGHTDDQGTESVNMRLSQQRSEAVMMHLVRQGEVNPDRLVAKGYGPTRPLADNGTDDGRATNRRVEFLILEQ